MGGMVAGNAAWSPGNLLAYYDAIHKHGTDWTKVAGELTDTGEQMCEHLYKQHQTFLRLPHSPALAAAFVAMVQDHFNNLKEEGPAVGRTTGHAAPHGSHDMGHEGANNGHGPALAGEDEGTMDGMPNDVHEAEDEGTSNQVPSQRSKRTPKPTAKVLAATPLSKRNAAVMSPRSASKIKSAEPEPGSARKRRQRRLFSDEADEQPPQPPYATRWKGQTRHDDFGEGIDALLSLATVAHNAHAASSSMNEALPQASVTPAPTVVTEPSAAAGTVDGTGTGGAAVAGGLDGEEAEGGIGRRSQGGVVGASHAHHGVMSPSKTKGGSARGTPGGATSSGAAGVKASPRRPSAVKSKGGRNAKGGNRFKRGGRAKRNMYASDSSLEDGGDYAERGPMTDPMLRTSSAASQLPRSTGLGKRSAEERRGGSRKRNVQQSNGNESSGDMGAHDGGMGMLSLEAGGADFYGYDLGAGHLPLNMAGQLDFARTADGAPLAPLSTALGDIAGLPLRQRRRKPAPERLAAMSPIMKALMPGGAVGSGGSGGNRNGGATSTPTASAAAAAAAAALSPSLLGSPTFLQGINMAMLAVSDPMTSPAETALRHCLSTPRLRRWTLFEFQVSAMDRPWFLRNELVELVSALCGGGALPQRLTRPEWSLVRSAFGRPRRLSLQFLKEERVKLEAYREHVRRVYEQAAAGGPPVPPELPQPLRVGQAVVARHPGTRQLHDGTLLTVMGSKCRVQFNRSELMTEVVRDVDIMPVDPYENLPLSLPVVPAVLNGRVRPLPGPAGLTRRRAVSRLIPRGAPADVGRIMPGGAAAAFHSALGAMGMPGSAGPGDGGDVAADDALAAEVTRLLEEKGATVARLRQLNDEAEGSKLAVEQSHPESFQQAYSQVVLKLKEVNAKLEPLLERLSGRARHASLFAAAAAAAAGAPPSAAAGGLGSLGDLGSPLAAIPPGSAMAGPLSGAFQPEALAGMQLGQGSGRTGASNGGSAQGQAEPGSTPSGDNNEHGTLMVASTSVPQGGGTAMSDSATVASAIVAAATADARVMVDQARGSLLLVPKLEDGLTHVTGAGLSDLDAADTSTPLVRLVTSCMAMLLTVQQCTGEAVSGPVSEHALDSAARLLQPVSAGNEEKLAGIMEQIQTLKTQLATR